MRISFFSQRVPYPPDRGDKINTFHEIRHLSADHDVEIFCLADGKGDLENADGLRGIAKAVCPVLLRPMPAKARALSALVRGKPFTIGYFRENELRRIIADRYRSNPPDLILVYSSGMAQYAEDYSTVPRIMQFVDLDSLKWQQYAENSVFPMRAIYALEARRLLAYEDHIARAFSHSLVSTKDEESDFRALIPEAAVSCVSNGVDLSFFRPADSAKNGHSVVFTGVMDYLPNIDAVAWFCRDVLPLVRRTVPDVRFTICGSRPTAEVETLGKLPGVEVTGRVPDVRPYLDRAGVAVLPLRLARGIQNKLLEAMAMGLPCVTTPRAFAGVSAEPGRDLFVAEGAAAFAERVVALLENADLRRAMGANARDIVERSYSWEAQLAELDRVIETVTETRS